MRRASSLVVLACGARLLLGCGDPHDDGAGDGGPAVDGGPGGDAVPWQPELGATYTADGALEVKVASGRATRLELWIYAEPTGAAERLRVPMTRASDRPVFVARVAADELAAAGVDTVYYGLRAWGPNWPYDPAWRPGSLAGFVADVDADGNRMNPNKLLFDPYARELSHDPITETQRDGGPYRTGDDHRAIDSAPVAPKAIALPPAAAGDADLAGRPTRSIIDEVVYEVHLRGLTRADPAAGDCAGTYAGAATRAAYLADLGVTAIELLPVHETTNDGNDADPTSNGGDNYWGYSTLAYLAPDRRYACDRRPGGPTRELREMVRAFHRHGIKVYLDVVYNHTAEGSGGSLLSLRGLDNAGYYQLDRAGTGFTSHTGVGADVAADQPLAAGLILDSLRYFAWGIGVDGFRFDLAPVLGNRCGPGCFEFEPDGLLAEIAAALPARPDGGGVGVDLVAEPWAIGAGTYQVGNFPAGWSEWNDRFRDVVRADQNRLGVEAVTPGALAARLGGSPDLFADDGRSPAATINFVVAHDGFTLRDLHACADKDNDQPWPYGPSNGGSNDNRSWNHGGDPVAQRQAARTGLALVVLAAGVPMLVGGDEVLRGQRCNNNPYNLDSPATWHDWSQLEAEAAFATFTRRLLAFRAAHPALRAPGWLDDAERRWYRSSGEVADAAYLADPGEHFLAWRLDGASLGDPAAAIYVAYNGGTGPVAAQLPPPGRGNAWYRVADTAAWLEPEGNAHPPGDEGRLAGTRYDLAPRSLVLLIAAQ